MNLPASDWLRHTAAEAPGSSAAKAMETAAIKLLRQKGWKLLSDRDAAGRQTPSPRS